jgi:hypothetical protein
LWHILHLWQVIECWKVIFLFSHCKSIDVSSIATLENVPRKCLALTMLYVRAMSAEVNPETPHPVLMRIMRSFWLSELP